MIKEPVFLEITSHLSIGGMQRAMQEFAIGLKDKGYSVYVGALNISGPRRKILENNGITVLKITRDNIEVLIRKYNISIVHSHGGPISWFYQKCKTVQEVVFHSMVDSKVDLNLFISDSLLYKTFKNPLYKLGKNALRLYYPQNISSWRKYITSKEELLKSRKRFGFTKENIIVGRVGRAEPSKTDYLLLNSVPKIAKKFPSIRFLFVGLPLLYRFWLLRYPSLWKKCVFLPETADDKQLAYFYQIIDIFWHTASRGETFGNVNAEAMIFKKPVITHYTPFSNNNYLTTDVAQCEVVEHEKTGLVASYPWDIVLAIQILHSKKLRVKYGENGYDKVCKEFSSKKIISDFVDVSKALLNEKPLSAKSIKESKKFFKNFKLINSKQIKLHKGELIYTSQKKLYFIFEFFYLGFRYILRKYLKKDIEKLSLGLISWNILEK